jgi:hypothetical protein
MKRDLSIVGIDLAKRVFPLGSMEKLGISDELR